MESFDVVVIGAGFAGVATAYHLTRLGAGRVLILEKEDAPGIHSSGRNASMIRQVVRDPDIGVLARAGAAFIRTPPEAWSEPVPFEENGSLLLSSGAPLEALKGDMATAQAAGVRCEYWQPAQCVERVSVLEGADFEGAVWCPSDGLVDAAALLGGYLREARKGGAQVRLRCPVERFENKSGRVEVVHTAGGPVGAGAVVNASGAWARQIGQMAGAADLPLTPNRRHLYSTGALDWVKRDWPFVWDVAHDVYFRPESGGLLTSPCDEAPWEPEMPEEDPAIIELLAEKLARHMPRLADIPILRGWAGLRTIATDRKFVIGRDPRAENFFWAAGLGGHGVTTSAAAGELAAKMVLRLEKPPKAFDPARFV